MRHAVKRLSLTAIGGLVMLAGAGCQALQGSIVDTLLPVLGSTAVSWLLSLLIPTT